MLAVQRGVPYHRVVMGRCACVCMVLVVAAACESDDGSGMSAAMSGDSGDGDGGDDAGDDFAPDDEEGGGDGSVQQLCVDTINMYRATLDLPPYTRWTDAESCSDDEAASDSMTMQAHGAFGMCGESAQNECPGWPAPPESMIEGCLELMWAEGPGEDFQAHGHYINMSSTEYTQVACGFHVTADGSVWAVQNFRR